MSDRRDDPPDPVKRQLRQEAGFGCCRCGFPVFQYHHIVPYHKDPHFRPEDMMVLCPNCHDMATKGAIPETQQRKYKANPCNIRRGFANGRLVINQDIEPIQPWPGWSMITGLPDGKSEEDASSEIATPVVDAGNTWVAGTGPFLLIDDEPILSIDVDDDRIELSATIYAEDDTLLTTIVRNEWSTVHPTPWDLEFSHHKLKIRRGSRRISLTVDASQVSDGFVKIRGSLWKNGRNIRISEDGVTLVGSAGGLKNGGWVKFSGMVLNRMSFNINTVDESIEMKYRKP